ncbi:hypothetical protein F5883DRAFT_722692 [Diaporthe sp. PMI_573]|nr:hypothetical protein F5883DRAFT_722692 [Diaporthaceae sp. PMI_573]
MSSKYVVRYRLLVLLFTFLTLVASALSSANIRFAVVLRERARSGYVDNTHVILDMNFAALQSNLLVASVIAAVPAALFSVFGFALALHRRWLADNHGSITIFILLQLVVDLFFVVIGGYCADKIQGLQTSFTKFGGHDRIPYYNIIYFGSVAQAGYGATFMITAVVTGVVFLIYDHHQTQRARAQAAVERQEAPAEQQTPRKYENSCSEKRYTEA